MLAVWNEHRTYKPGNVVLVKYVPPADPVNGPFPQHGACLYVANATNTNEPPAGSSLWDAQGCLTTPTDADEG